MPTERSAAARADTAPEPDASAKADSPTDLTRRGLTHTLKAAVQEFQRDQCTDLAAALTYFSVLSVAPALLALVSLLGVVGQDQQTVETMLDLVRQLGQGDVAEQLRGPIEGMVQSEAAGFTLVVGLLTALSSASAYVGAFGRALNRVYGVDEGRPIWKLRPVTFAVTLGLVVGAALVLLGLVVSGSVAEAVGDLIGLGDQSVVVWGYAKWPVMLVIVMAMVALLYWATPNIRQPRFRWLSPGAVAAILVWVLASVAFGFYIANFGKYQSTYGSLGGVIVFLLWLWLTNIALLLGAEVDAELERVRELEAGMRAERAIQLPPRDTTQSDKAREKLEERIAEGRAIRRAAVADGATGALPERRRRRHGAATPEDVRLEPLPSDSAAAQRRDGSGTHTS
ncbi:YihY family inner membrane protein [Phycicoccus sp. CSK15P-2]|uniref:YhjD/YihY/BrkB family envelope integrity protein n=1 Tax=Phycicoccus sp. CSK15P-2 TaxID=2807627 RepID=UPI001950F85B|nr:YhjD/YihY/BrkB family envelope integrity protein [Phycicoccus sp. CSK15P-2]MBM6403108.1 YihY family inner membrane protein [Phycicoccus sp. CSK15P-2]